MGVGVGGKGLQMGQSMTYAIGKLNINRRVRCFSRDGTRHASVGTLEAATPKHAIIRLDHHKKTEHIEWANVLDWTAGNKGVALVLPGVSSDVPGNPVPASKRAEPAAPLAAKRVEPPGPVSDVAPESLNDFGTRLSEALREYRTACQMYADAKTLRDEAAERLARIRADLGRAMSMTEDVLAEALA